MSFCETPCSIHSNTKYCILKKSEQPAGKKKLHWLKPRSKKRIKEQPLYVAMVKEAAEIDNRCEVCSPVCTYYMQGFNHTQKSSPKNRMVRANLKRSCNPCNGYIENNQEWAELNGHFISKYKD